MEKELISVVVPVYNVDQYLNECVNSIINQSYKKLQIILVDDGSTDKSGMLCDEYELNDKRVTVIHKKNGGLSSARNAGIEIAEGEYIYFVDSDDFINERCLEICKYYMEKNNADIVQVKFKSFERRIVHENLQDIKEIIYSREEALISLAQFTDKVTNLAWDKLYKAKLFESIRYPEGKIHEDEFTTYKVMDCINKYVYIPEELYYYRKRMNSIKNSKFSLNRMTVLEAYDERREYYKNQKKEVLYNMTTSIYCRMIVYTYFSLKRSGYNNNEMKEMLNKYKSIYRKEKDNFFIKDKRQGILFVYCRIIYYWIWKKRCTY